MAVGRVISEVFPWNAVEQIVLLFATVFMSLLCAILAWRSWRAISGAVTATTGFGLSLFGFLFLFGLWHSSVCWKKVHVSWPEAVCAYKGVLTEPPRQGVRSVSAECVITASEETEASVGRHVALTFASDTLSQRLRVGDEVTFVTRMRPPKNHGNPEEFDYAGYLYAKGVSGTAYVRSGRWSWSGRVGESYVGGMDRMTVWRIDALQLRARLSGLYRTAGLQGEELALFSAITLGDRSGLSRELREVYAETGVSHVLALSGMHLGFLVALLNFLFLRRTRRRGLRIAGVCAVWMLIWGYAFLAGLPPSLIRASLMYSLMLCGSLMGRDGFSLNSLAVAAFLMLCLNPLWLYDVGFQLSFLAMSGILTVGPALSALMPRCPRGLGWVRESLSISVAAQLFTLPWTAHVFGTVALWSVWVTLFVAPLVALLIYAMPLVWLAGWTGVGMSYCADAVAALVRVQHAFLRAVASLPWASVEVDFPLLSVCAVYALCIVCLLRRNMAFPAWLKLLFVTGIATVCVCVAGIRINRVRPGLIFYYSPSSPMVHVVCSPSTSYLLLAETDSLSVGVTDYAIRAFRRKKLTEEPQWLRADGCYGRVSLRNGLVTCADGPAVLILNDNRLDGLVADRPVAVDYVWVTRGFQGCLRDVGRLFLPCRVVLDASLDSRTRQRLLDECRLSGWPCHDIYSQGALVVPFP